METWITNNLSTLLIQLITAPIALFLLQLIFKESLIKYLSKKVTIEVENHKHELQKEADHLKYDLQKSFAKFESLYKSKSIIYPELYKLLKIAEGAVLGLYGFSTSEDLQGVTAEYLHDLLTKNNYLPSTTEEVYQLAIQDLPSGIKKYEKLERNRQFNKADQFFSEAKNHWIINELYFSKAVFDATDNFVKVLAKIKANYYTTYITGGQHPLMKFEDRDREIDQASQNLKIAIQSEIAVESQTCH